MRILFVDRAGAHAIWSIVRPVAERLINSGHDVVYCLLDDGNQREQVRPPSGAMVRHVPAPRANWGKATFFAQSAVFGRSFRRILAELEPQVVHTHFCIPGATARCLARRAGVPAVVSTQHELYGSMSPHLRLGVRLTERCADAVVYVSETVARSFGRAAEPPGAGGRAPGRPRHLMIHNGVDVAGITRTIAGVVREPETLVCAGRLVGVKGQAVLMRALPAILHARPEIRLTLIGSGPDEASLRALAAELGIVDRVHFAGWRSRDETLRAMARVAAIVIPSDGRQEGFGLVVAEAMACGTPLAVSDIPVFREVMGGECCGNLFTSGAPDALAAAVTRLLADSEDTARRAARARARVTRLFSLDDMATRYLKLYEELLAPNTETVATARPD